MAIKISGTTVIDDSRNLCNIANVNANNLNADVGGAYVCRMACTAITEGEPVMYPSDAVCAAEACVSAIAPSILSDENINACFTHTYAVSRFCASCNCFVSLYLRSLSKSDIYCSVGMFVCISAHCVGTDGSVSCTCILECCVCNPNCCDGLQICGYPIGLESCQGYVTYFKVPAICCTGGSSTQEWLYTLCLNCTTCQVSLVCVNQSSYSCRFASFGWVTPDRRYYMNYWHCFCYGQCPIPSDGVGVSVSLLNDNARNGLISTQGRRSTLVCGLPMRCTQLVFDCYQWAAAEGDDRVINQFLGVAPFTYGCDGWTIVQDYVQSICNPCLGYTYGKVKMFAIKPLGENCFRTTCCFYEANGVCQERDGCYCYASALMCCLLWYRGPNYCNASYNGAVDSGDGIKKFMYSQWGCYCSGPTRYMVCFCVSADGYICDQGTFGSTCNTCDTSTSVIDHNWMTTRGTQGGGNLSSAVIYCCGSGGYARGVCPCQVCEYVRYGQLNTRRGWTSRLRNQAVRTDMDGYGGKWLGSMDADLYRSSWPTCPCTGTYISAAGIAAMNGSLSIAGRWDVLWETATCCVFSNICGYSGWGSTNFAVCYHVGPADHWCCCCSCSANYAKSDCQCCATIATNGCFTYQTGLMHNRFDIRCNNIFFGQSGCVCGHRQCWIGAGGIIPMHNCTVWVAGGNGGTEVNWVGPNEAGCMCYTASIEVYTSNFSAPNHNRFLGIAQNTVSAGETVKIAVPGTVDRSSFTCNYIINCLGCHLTGQSGPVQLHMYQECRSPLACRVFGAYDGSSNPFICTYGGGAFFTFFPNYDCGSNKWISYISIPGAGPCIAKF